MVGSYSLLVNDPWGYNKRELRKTIVNKQYQVGREFSDYMNRYQWCMDKDKADYWNTSFVRAKRNIEVVRK